MMTVCRRSGAGVPGLKLERGVRKKKGFLPLRNGGRPAAKVAALRQCNLIVKNKTVIKNKTD